MGLRSSTSTRGRRGLAALAALAMVIATGPIAPAGMAVAAAGKASVQAHAGADHCQDQDQAGAMDCGCAQACVVCAHGPSACVQVHAVPVADPPGQVASAPATAHRILPPGLPERPPRLIPA